MKDFDKSGVIIFCIECQSVCHFVGIGSPRPHTPSPQASVSSPLGSKGGEQHSLAGEGLGGHNSDDWTESLTLCILYDCRLVAIVSLLLFLYKGRSYN
jgi:hypothetical protein